MKSSEKINGPSFEIEAGLFAQGYRFIAGVDEAGRGALAGSLLVGLCVYDSSLFNDPVCDELRQVNDSKMLSGKRRKEILSVIRSRAVVAEYCEMTSSEVDELNVNAATFEAVKRLLRIVKVPVDCVIMDGNFRFKLDVPFIPVIKGDAKSISIASASIVAKVTRDEMITALDEKYPEYGFAIHKGYGTASHREAILRYGGCNIHRRTYDPLRSMLESPQRELF
ncbi:MAG TPA: ribonuclease HII [Spirochaetota bacterium]|nr:ribonuclease HII [Spirochaetota bacterium]